MLERPADLPDYDRPPVDEVILGVQHHPIPDFDVAVRRYWDVVKSDYPTVQYQPRVEAPLERLAEESSIIVAPPPLPLQSMGRTWLVSSDDSFLIQIQNDRFLHNWRYREKPYPRFERLHELFTQRYQGYRTALSEAELPPLQPFEVEVSYVNWITDQPVESFLALAARAQLSVPGVDSFPNQQQWIASYFVRSGGRPVARLTVSHTPAVRMGPSPSRGTQFGLTVKAPLSPHASDSEVHQFMAMGRDVIVRTFTALTTKSSQELWGRRR